MIKQYAIKSNGDFGLLHGPFEQDQHTNQQNGLNLYVNVVDFSTHMVNNVKLYENTKGLHFRKQGNHYLSDFTQTVIYVPFQIIKVDEDV